MALLSLIFTSVTRRARHGEERDGTAYQIEPRFGIRARVFVGIGACILSVTGSRGGNSPSSMARSSREAKSFLFGARTRIRPGRPRTGRRGAVRVQCGNLSPDLADIDVHVVASERSRADRRGERARATTRPA